MEVFQQFSNIPKCRLTKRLAEFAATGPAFDIFGTLDRLRERVSEEVKYIPLIFPEYTPHDEPNHLGRLFDLADRMLGDAVVDNLNRAELFVLCACLYGHDWGMAVSKDERDFITKGLSPDNRDFWTLPDEDNRLRLFIADRGLDYDDIRANGLPDPLWADYVRETHPFRSGERVRHYFHDIDDGLGRAAMRVCIGHGVDFAILDDRGHFPEEAIVLGQKIDLVAIAIYVRLIDLFDIARDRTPYTVWKFVAPRNKHSQMEWAKHRALDPVVCDSFQGGRRLIVRGSTDSHDVWAACEDLRDYCESQLRQANDRLAKSPAQYHLNLFYIDWHVEADGFKPISLRFEFDRGSMFKILSDEIYEGDTHVFLRELLQNSIDAIRVRQEIQPADTTVQGVIRVKVDHHDNGDVDVTWTDNGVGMDEYIIKNYLTVAGRSYFRSDDFLNLGLKIDPISRFGIGILSCFMVASEIEITTTRDSVASRKRQAFRLTIPDVERRIRIDEITYSPANVGTIVKVHIKSDRLDDDLAVTEYLAEIAGFVEYPILVAEQGITTAIISPYYDDKELYLFEAADQVRKLHLGIDFDAYFEAEDVALARKYFTQESFVIEHSTKLASAGYQGTVTCLITNSDVVDIGIYEDSFHLCTNDEDWVVIALRDPARSKLVYLNGILVSNALHNVVDSKTKAGYVLRVNITKPKEINVDRKSFKDMEEWYRSITTERDFILTEAWQVTTKQLAIAEQFYSLGKYCVERHVPPQPIANVLRGDMPVALLTARGKLTYALWSSLAERDIWTPIVRTDSGEYMESVLSGDVRPKPLSNWQGNLLIQGFGSAYMTRYDKILDVVMKRDRYIHRYIAVEPRINHHTPPGVMVWVPKSATASVPKIDEDFVSGLTDNAELIADIDLDLLPVSRPVYCRIVGFSQPKFAVRIGSDYLLNIGHRLARLILITDLRVTLGLLNCDAELRDQLADYLGGVGNWSFIEKLETLLFLAQKAGIGCHTGRFKLCLGDFWDPIPLFHFDTYSELNPRFGLPLENCEWPTTPTPRLAAKPKARKPKPKSPHTPTPHRHTP